MTQAASFGTSHRNALLETLVGKTDTLYNASTPVGYFSYAGAAYLQMYSSPYGDTSAPMGAATNYGNPNQWGAAIGGTAPFNMSWTSNVVTADVVWARWLLYHPVYGYTAVVDGHVTLTGGGGMLIIPALSIPTNSTVQLSGTLIMPLNNSGTLRINQAMANNLLNELIYMTNAPQMGVNGSLSFYDGAQPATADTAVTSQTQLSVAQYAMSSSTFTSASGGIIALAAAVTPASVATANGTATWFRWVKGANVMDGSAGLTGSGADAILASTTFSTGANCPALNSFTLTLP